MPRRRRGVADTSLEALASSQRTFVTQRYRVLDFIAHHGGCSRQVIAEGLCLPLQSVCGRVGELMARESGGVEVAVCGRHRRAGPNGVRPEALWLTANGLANLNLWRRRNGLQSVDVDHRHLLDANQPSPSHGPGDPASAGDPQALHGDTGAAQNDGQADSRSHGPACPSHSTPAGDGLLFDLGSDNPHAPRPRGHKRKGR